MVDIIAKSVKELEEALSLFGQYRSPPTSAATNFPGQTLLQAALGLFQITPSLAVTDPERLGCSLYRPVLCQGFQQADLAVAKDTGPSF